MLKILKQSPKAVEVCDDLGLELLCTTLIADFVNTSCIYHLGIEKTYIFINHVEDIRFEPNILTTCKFLINIDVRAADNGSVQFSSSWWEWNHSDDFGICHLPCGTTSRSRGKASCRIMQPAIWQVCGCCYCAKLQLLWHGWCELQADDTASLSPRPDSHFMWPKDTH